MTPRFVIFDCDGVLVDSETLTNASCSTTSPATGCVLTAAPRSRALFVGGTMKAVGEKAARDGRDAARDWLEDIYDDDVRARWPRARR